MHVEETGTGTPLLLLHAGGVAGWVWRPTLASLGTGVRALVPDLPGHGRSGRGPWPGHAQVVDELAGLLAERAPSGAVVAGFSLGGQLAIALAAARPDLVQRVVVVSAQTLPLPLAGPTLTLLGAAAPLAGRPRFARLQAGQLGIPADLVDEYVSGSAALGRDTLVSTVAANLGFRLPPALSSFPGRAVVMVGGREPRLMRQSARATHTALPGSLLVQVAECHHDLPLRRPDLVARACRAGGLDVEGAAR